MVSEFDQSIRLMKYVVNHPWKFRSYHLAFITGFLQFTICIIIEVSNVWVLMGNSDNHFDIVANFVVILVVAQFDDYFYKMRAKDEITNMVENSKTAFRWETTTSFDAIAKIKENELEPENVLLTKEKNLRPKYIRISFSQRTCMNKLYYLMFRSIQLIYTSFYYYFFPWVASFLLNFILLSENKSVA